MVCLSLSSQGTVYITCKLGKIQGTLNKAIRSEREREIELEVREILMQELIR